MVLEGQKTKEALLFWIYKRWNARSASKCNPKVSSPAAGLAANHDVDGLYTETRPNYLPVIEDNKTRPFRDSIDAFLCALHTDATDGQSTEILCSIGYSCNGLNHCSVQVTRGCVGFRMDAYGEEAYQLHRMAKKYSAKMTVCPTVI